MNRLDLLLDEELRSLDAAGTRKGAETVIMGIEKGTGGRGPRMLLEGEPGRGFLRMNSNGYLGLADHPEVVAAEERAVRAFGAGPQAVRFISGTFSAHVQLEKRLADFHGRPAGMIFSSAYATMTGVLPSLVGDDTAVISDELNHNCIINAIRLGEPREKYVYSHLNMKELADALDKASKHCRRAIVVTDGVFSMRGDNAALDEINLRIADLDERFAENIVTLVDDSHGVGALGETGRGVEEVCGAQADILVATLGKALGVNGGYVVGSEKLVSYLRERAPLYVYSNPITPGEAAAASRAVEILDSGEGRALLARLRERSGWFRGELTKLGFETVPGEHPVVPLLTRDTGRTRALVRHLREHGILATGLTFPVVPRGEEEIRFQISAQHTRTDIDEVLRALAAFVS